MVEPTSSGSRMAANGTNTTPSAKALATSASCTASRVLPEPGGPVNVSNRLVTNRCRTSGNSRSRPRNLLSGTGRAAIGLIGGNGTGGNGKGPA